MLIKLTQVIKEPSRFLLKTIFVNPNHVVTITEDEHIKNINETTGPLLEGLSASHDFSRLSINSGSQSRSITVVGSPESVMSALKKNHRQLIKG